MATIPTVEITGPAGRLIINEVDLSSYRARGYRLMTEPAPVESQNDVPLEKMLVSELKETANQMALDVSGMTKSEMVKAIRSAHDELK